MVGFIVRVLIVIAVFLAGVLAGNIFMPQKRLETYDITALAAPQTTLNLTRTPSLSSTLKAVQQQEEALSATGMDPEVLFSWTEMTQRTLYLLAYRAAKATYELELLKVQHNPANRADFLKAQTNYNKLKAALEAAYPPVIEEQPTSQEGEQNGQGNSVTEQTVGSGN